MTVLWISKFQPTFRERAEQGRFHYIIVQVFHAVATVASLLMTLTYGTAKAATAMGKFAQSGSAVFQQAMTRTSDLSNWHAHNKSVLEEYPDLAVSERRFGIIEVVDWNLTSVLNEMVEEYSL